MNRSIPVSQPPPPAAPPIAATDPAAPPLWDGESLLGGRDGRAMIAQPEPVGPEARHVLIVGHSPEITDLLRMILEEEGYRVSASHPVPDAATIAPLRPDVIVADPVFDRGRGIDAFLAEWGHHPDLHRVPVLLCTADVELARAVRADLPDQRFAVVVRPFDIDQLLRGVEDCLRPVPPVPPVAAG